MSLSSELTAFAEGMSKQAPEETLSAIGGYIESLLKGERNSLEEGDTAPNFSLKNSEGS